MRGLPERSRRLEVWRPRTVTVKQATIWGPRFSSCSARPVIWPSAWCSRRSTGWPSRAFCPRDWLLVGNGRGDVAHEDFRAHVHNVLTEFGPHPEPDAWKGFAERVLFAGGGFNSGSPGSLLEVLEEAGKSLGGDPQLVHYLAVPPVAFAETTKALGGHGLAKDARVVYEKPFGTSQQAFRSLDRTVHSVLDEQQVYRIDHFLGKEATQDLHLLRFANELFAAMWCREHVESVQIDVPEKLGITDRSVFYDATGAVLDMLVTHLFQVAAEVAMEPPARLGALR